MTQLAIFAKYWRPGEAKTRLASAFGPKVASRLTRAFLKTMLDRLQNVAATRHLVIAPSDVRRAFSRLARGRFEIVLQSSGVLGERLQHCFEHLFAGGAQRVVVLGADSPTIPLDYVEQAFAELEYREAVIGPSRDGGYYLIGLRDRVLPLFEGIDWGTSSVFQQTLERLRSLKVGFNVLPQWYDVDTPADLRQLCRDLTAPASGDPSCGRLLRTVRRLTGIHT